MTDPALRIGDRVQSNRSGDFGVVEAVAECGKIFQVRFERAGLKWINGRMVAYSPDREEILRRAIELAPWRESNSN